MIHLICSWRFYIANSKITREYTSTTHVQAMCKKNNLGVIWLGQIDFQCLRLVHIETRRSVSSKGRGKMRRLLAGCQSQGALRCGTCWDVGWFIPPTWKGVFEWGSIIIITYIYKIIYIFQYYTIYICIQQKYGLEWQN